MNTQKRQPEQVSVSLAVGWLLETLHKDRAIAPHMGDVSAQLSQRSQEHGGGFTTFEINLALRSLKRRGLAEKWRPDGWRNQRPLPWRLTEAGETIVVNEFEQR